MQKVYFRIFIVFVYLYIFAEQNSAVYAQSGRSYYLQEDFCSMLVDSLKEIYGSNKQIPAQLEIAFYTAILHFPELQNACINLKFRNIRTTMACRPRIGGLFKNSLERCYLISINDNKQKAEIQYNNLTFNALVGVIGHELSHIVKYMQCSNFRVIGDGILYLSSDFRESYEKEVDEITIKHNLGWQIFEFSSYIFYQANVSPEYLNYKKRYYYSPEELEILITEFYNQKNGI